MLWKKRQEAATPATTTEMPAAERAHLNEAYDQAETILEYGSGASTEYAATLLGKTVFSVESDAEWCRELSQRLPPLAPSTKIHLRHVDIGKTGQWGRPLAPDQWQKFHTYPLSIWQDPAFHHPDLVLIDGRFRVGCFAATCIHAQKPIRVVFDDYTPRDRYHIVEEFFEPIARIGRMAEFLIEPRNYRAEQIARLVSFFARVSYARA